jgi:hypothetical protein
MANGKIKVSTASVKAPNQSRPKPASGKARPVTAQKAPTTGPGGANNARDAAGKVGGKC